MSNPPVRVGIVGAGYIAAWHADAIQAVPEARLTAVADVSEAAARALAEGHGVPAFGSLAAMAEAGLCDAVHILTPPHLHRALAEEALGLGLHVFVEKPFALSEAEARAMLAAAEAAGRQIGVCHNFLGLPAYERMKRAHETGALGRVGAAEIRWHLPLAPLRSGPYGLWLLREPKNLLLELGPHLVAFAHDLFGPVAPCALETAKPVALPGTQGTRPQSWRILARAGAAGAVDVTFDLALTETMDDRTVTLSGSSATARLDYAADTLIVARQTASDIVIGPFRREMGLAWQHVREGTANAARQLASLNRKSPYGLSFRGAIGAFHRAVRDGTAMDPRVSGASAAAVMGTLEAALAHLPAEAPPAPPAAARAPDPSVVVIGGTGFIGAALTRGLVASGRDVRVLSRGRFGPFGDLADRVETVPVALTDKAALVEAMRGVDAVYHLARALETTWEACLENDVGVTETIAEAALEAGVRRFVYTGTIASYDMSDPGRPITEATGFAEDMTDRNLYARSKAECEARLLALHRARGLPLVIARPGIVIGPGGPLQHWGIGRWHGAGAVRIWGQGRNILPFVLIDDVVDGLVKAIEVEGAVGRSFNLVGEPMMTARDYFDAIEASFGARIEVVPGRLTLFYLSDWVKYALKRHILGRKGAIRASLKDWKSRAHYAPFRIEETKRVLGWQPEADRDAFVRRGIAEARLFGF